jgi:hypothetical protein
VEKGAIININNCHYDKQMCLLGAVATAEHPEVTAHLTRDMVGNKLSEALGTAD